MSHIPTPLRAPAENLRVHEVHPQPAVSAADAEAFWTDGVDARSHEPGSADRITADVPGVGVVLFVSPDSEDFPTETAGNVTPIADEREQLLCQLIFAAKDLAEQQLEPSDPDNPEFCTECCVDECDGVIAHEPVCRTGRVLRIIKQLCAQQGGAR